MDTPEHVENYRSNMAEVLRLLEIHTQLAGATPGRKHKMEVLNQSRGVLAVACWEAFIEDLAATAFDYMLKAAAAPTVFRPLAYARTAPRPDGKARLIGTYGSAVVSIPGEKSSPASLAPLGGSCVVAFGPIEGCCDIDRPLREPVSAHPLRSIKLPPDRLEQTAFLR